MTYPVFSRSIFRAVLRPRLIPRLQPISHTVTQQRIRKMGDKNMPPEGAAGEALPKLSAADFHKYNRMAEHMDQFHNHFRQSWTTLYDACVANRRPKNISMLQFLRVGLDLCKHLDAHHSIEEQYIFPQLSKRMPAFRQELELIDQHKTIHAGLEKLREYLEDCRSGERELRLPELKEVMDGFGTVLWEHMDDEVRELGAENMRKYWSLEEMARMPM